MKLRLSVKTMNRLEYRKAVVARSVLGLRTVQAIIASLYHQLFWHRADQTWKNTRWLGVEIQKLPLDMIVYQEIITELRPDVIVETGTRFGGSAWYFATILDLLENGRVVTVDVDSSQTRPQHERITYLAGSSLDGEVIESIRRGIRADDTVMVVLDSDHSASHVREELELYAPLVSPGSYLIAEDGAVHRHPVRGPDGRVIAWDGGPRDAVKHFLKSHPDFAQERGREKFFVTENPGGWLKRLR